MNRPEPSGTARFHPGEKERGSRPGLPLHVCSGTMVLRRNEPAHAILGGEMGKGLKPDWYLESLYSVTPQQLRDLGVSGLLLDIDNTLVPNHMPDADEQVITFVSRMQEAGIRLAILSNAGEHRKERFNRPLGLPVVPHALKPFRKGYLEGLALLGLPAGQVAMAGDQLFTDIWGANAAGCRSLLLLPMHRSEPWYVRLKRLLEKLVMGGMKPAAHL